MKNQYGRAICYSGFREGQAPYGEIPSYDQIKEDLELLLQLDMKYIRMYSPNEYAKKVLDVIKNNDYPIKVILGMEPQNEANHPNCPWDKNENTKEELLLHRKHNDEMVFKTIDLAKQYENQILAISVGNENTADWTSNPISEQRLMHFAQMVRLHSPFKVTFNEGYFEWTRLPHLAKVVDFISMHTYPFWHKCEFSKAADISKDEYQKLVELYQKEVVIGEAGWPTSSNDGTIDPYFTTELYQKSYLTEMWNWAEHHSVLFFTFEAFDEPWKGGSNPLEAEKNWGIFHCDRTPKRIVKEYFKSNE